MSKESEDMFNAVKLELEGASPDFTLLQQDLTEDQRQIFQHEFNAAKKDAGNGMLLAFFLGGLGAHRFYLDDSAKGVLYLLFCWTFFTFIIGALEAFVMPLRVQNYNEELAKTIIAKIKVNNPSIRL